jgi:hypothetical protein
MDKFIDTYIIQNLNKRVLTTQKLLDTINSKVAGYKINLQKSVAFLYTNNKLRKNTWK